MVSLLTRGRAAALAVDIGACSVKLAQFSGDRTRWLDAVRWEFTPAGEEPPTGEARWAAVSDSLVRAREGRSFRGREAVICLTGKDLFLHSVRAPKTEGAHLVEFVEREIATRLPFPLGECELRMIEAADIRQGDAVLKEVIVLACHRPVLEQLLAAVEAAGLRPIAVDAEPLALLRGFVRQQRRDEDRRTRTLYVHVGYSRTMILIAEGDDLLFVKYADVGGQSLDEAVARRLQMQPRDAAALRRSNGDRRADQQDPEISASLQRAVRPVIDRLASELSLCTRYHSVTFRGQPLSRLVLGGGEATPALLDSLAERLNLKCELSDPLRGFTSAPRSARVGQWDLAAGLAWRDAN